MTVATTDYSIRSDRDPADTLSIGPAASRSWTRWPRSIRVPAVSAQHAITAVVFLALSLGWEIGGHTGALGRSVVAPSTAVANVLANLDVYWLHGRATLTVALIGLLIGSAIGIVAAVGFVLWPVSESVLGSTLLVAYCSPPILLAPVLAATFSIGTTRIVIVALMVSYAFMLQVKLSIRSVDPLSLAVVRGLGGGTWQQFWKVRAPASVPGILTGVQVAIPTALLGAMLAEYTGGRWGLGLYLVSGLKSGDHELVWGVTLAAAVLSGGAYLIAGWFADRARARRTAPTTPTGHVQKRRARGTRAISGRLLGLAGAIGMPLLLWAGFVAGFGKSDIVTKGPVAVIRSFIVGPGAAQRREMIVSAAQSTIWNTALGFAVGLVAALLLAIVFDMVPTARGAIVPLAIVVQTIPLAALVPLLLVSIGRGTQTMIAIGVVVTFFPSFAMICNGLAETPPVLVDLVRVSGGGHRHLLRKVKLPSAIPHVSAAARLLAPRALLGVVLAEYVATGDGLGYLVYRARGTLDYSTMWAASVVAVLISVAVFMLAGRLESMSARRFEVGS